MIVGSFAVIVWGGQNAITADHWFYRTLQGGIVFLTALVMMGRAYFDWPVSERGDKS